MVSIESLLQALAARCQLICCILIAGAAVMLRLPTCLAGRVVLYDFVHVICSVGGVAESSSSSAPELVLRVNNIFRKKQGSTLTLSTELPQRKKRDLEKADREVVTPITSRSNHRQRHSWDEPADVAKRVLFPADHRAPVWHSSLLLSGSTVSDCCIGGEDDQLLTLSPALCGRPAIPMASPQTPKLSANQNKPSTPLQYASKEPIAVKTPIRTTDLAFSGTPRSFRTPTAGGIGRARLPPGSPGSPFSPMIPFPRVDLSELNHQWEELGIKLQSFASSLVPQENHHPTRLALLLSAYSTHISNDCSVGDGSQPERALVHTLCVGSSPYLFQLMQAVQSTTSRCAVHLGGAGLLPSLVPSRGHGSRLLLKLEGGNIGRSHEGVLIIPHLEGIRKRDGIAIAGCLERRKLEVRGGAGGDSTNTPCAMALIASCENSEAMNTRIDPVLLSKFDIVLPCSEIIPPDVLADFVLSRPAKGLLDGQRPIQTLGESPVIGEKAGALMRAFYMAARKLRDGMSIDVLHSMKRIATVCAALRGSPVVAALDALVGIALADEASARKGGWPPLVASFLTEGAPGLMNITEYYQRLHLFLESVRGAIRL
eukprot:NODE_308_length_2481_cov_38.766447_g285_i0.p1 GENE.NODE_308_length_2481_cov_38.766447_g285_i0~~NODE_308_length_2481_cov_38.766447_g285_i0.p1  ORF type:complete len:599 (-),score=75.90 NODE_308_length_2481_cov_38.766447_g285_i0:137-1933(-)